MNNETLEKTLDKQKNISTANLSVIIPNYNRSEMLKQTIDSIFAQTYKNLEIIVVDDKSTDNSIDVLKYYEKSRSNFSFFVNEKNSGPCFSRKFGFGKSKGEYIVFIDNDDYYTDENFFVKAVNKLSQLNQLALVIADSYHTEAKVENMLKINRYNFIKQKDFLEGMTVTFSKPASTFPAVFRKKALIAGGIEETEWVGDQDIYFRAALWGGCFAYNNPIGVYRLHANNLSKTFDTQFILDSFAQYEDIYKRLKQESLIDNPEKWLFTLILTTTGWAVGTESKNFNFVPLFEGALKIIKGDQYKKDFIEVIKLNMGT